MKMTSIICSKCGKECEKPTKEISRQIKQGRTKFYCSISCSTKDILTVHSSIKAVCLWCKKEFDTTTHIKARKCCSTDCAHKYAQSFVVWTDERKAKTSTIT